MKSKKHRSNERAIAWLILCAAAVAGIVFCIILLFTGRVKEIKITGGTTVYHIDDEQYELSAEPLVCDGIQYVPGGDILANCDYEVSWNNEQNALALKNKDGISYVYLDNVLVSHLGEPMQFANTTFSRKKVMYMPVDMVSFFLDESKEKMTIEGDLKAFKIPTRDCLENTPDPDDTYRLSGNVSEYNNVYVINGNVAMEQLYYPDAACQGYAQVINSIAAAFPESKVYDIAIPTMSEFYGPRQIYTNQTNGIRKIYQNLDRSVMPVNSVKALWEHAGEKLYFNTDHHWTQRGAFYVYCALLETMGEDVPSLDDFQTNNIENFVGSWKNFVKGTPAEAQLTNSPELMERFMPRVQYTGDIYSDQELTQRTGKSEVINLNDNTYSTFIRGDQPVTKYVSNAPSGKKAVVIKESYGDAFATWLVDYYTELYVIDPRYWNGFANHNNTMKLRNLSNVVGGFDDIIVISYPGSTNADIRGAIQSLVN